MFTASPVPPTDGVPLLELTLYCTAHDPPPEAAQVTAVLAPPRRAARLKIPMAASAEVFLSVSTAVEQFDFEASHALPFTAPSCSFREIVRLTEPMMPTEVMAQDAQVSTVHDGGVDTLVSVNVPRLSA